MMETSGYGSQIARGIFKIRSQTDPERYYEVKQDGDKLICSCPACGTGFGVFQDATSENVALVLRCIHTCRGTIRRPKESS